MTKQQLTRLFIVIAAAAAIAIAIVFVPYYLNRFMGLMIPFFKEDNTVLSWTSGAMIITTVCCIAILLFYITELIIDYIKYGK